MKATTRRTTVLFLATLLALPGSSWAGGIEDYALAKAVPADAFLSMHTRRHAGQAWLNQQYARVWKKVEDAKFDRDIKRLFREMSKESGQTPEQFDELWTKIVDLGAGVDWASLGEREYAFCMKLSFPTVEFVSMMMPPADKVVSNFEGLAGIIRQISAINPEMIALTTEGEGDTVIHKLSLPQLPREFSFGVTLARHKDTILVGFGSTLVEQSLAMLQGKEGKSMAANPRFQEAFKKLPPPTDNAAFCDMSLMTSQLRSMMADVFKQAETTGNPPREGDPGYDQYQMVKKLPMVLIDAMDAFDYSGSVSATDGMKTLSTAVMQMKPNAAEKPIYKILMGNGTLTDPLRYVPKDATNFSVGTGIDVAALWSWVMTLIRENVPDSESVLSGLAEFRERTGMDIEQDIIGWIHGGMTYVSVPGPTAFASGEFAMMLKVRDEAKAKAAVGKLIDLIQQNLTEEQGRIEDAEIADAPGFKVARIQFLGAMPGLPSKPTIGVKDGWLILASTPEFVTTVLDTAAGKAENFSKNPRYAAECVQTSGAVSSLSFTDQTQLGENLSMLFGSVGMVSMMAPPEVSRNPMFQSLMGACTKLSRVARELNFFQSESTASTVEGNTIVTRAMTTYREPPAPDKPKAEASEDKPNQ